MKTKNLQEKQYLLRPQATQFPDETVLLRNTSSKSDTRLAYIFLIYVKQFYGLRNTMPKAHTLTLGTGYQRFLL